VGRSCALDSSAGASRALLPTGGSARRTHRRTEEAAGGQLQGQLLHRTTLTAPRGRACARPAASRNCGSCVVLPLPVSPTRTSVRHAPSSATSCSRAAQIGSASRASCSAARPAPGAPVPGGSLRGVRCVCEQVPVRVAWHVLRMSCGSLRSRQSRAGKRRPPWLALVTRRLPPEARSASLWRWSLVAVRHARVLALCAAHCLLCCHISGAALLRGALCFVLAPGLCWRGRVASEPPQEQGAAQHVATELGNTHIRGSTKQHPRACRQSSDRTAHASSCRASGGQQRTSAVSPWRAVTTALL